MSSSRTRWLLLMLCMAVWLAGTLGILHRSVHGLGMHASASAESVEQPTSEGVQASSTADIHSYFAHLFGHHADNDCRLYDQLAHAAGLPSVPLLVLPLVLPTATFAWLEGEAVRRWVALFDARGPPVTC